VPASVDGVVVQEPSYTDIEALATLLQHCDCVVANAGTILLDSLVNDRPAVCVLYDEGAPPGERWAELNVVGEHYRQLMESDAFYRAHRFEEVADGIERALAAPDELAAERRRVARDVVGEVDGRAAERVVAAIVEVVGGQARETPRREPVPAPG
jgi:CDP-glycerol glycerophosphotransferase (TagB/SpsB family)